LNGTLLSPPSQWGTVRRVLGVWLVVFLTFGSPWAWATGYFVSAATGNDTNNGLTAGTAWKRITHALASVVAGDTITVAPGIYDTPNNGEVFPLALVNGVRVASSGGAGVTTIKGTAVVPVFQNNAPLSNTTELNGFLLNNTDTTGPTSNDIMDFEVGAGTMAPHITGNVFDGVTNQRDGIVIHDASAAAGQFTGLIELNRFDLLNDAIFINQNAGGADTFSPTIQQNTFTTNRYGVDMLIAPLAGGTHAPLITNNTFTNSSSADIYASISGADPLDTFAPTISNNTSTNSSGSVAFASIYVSLSPGTYDIAPTIINNGTVGTPLQGAIAISGNGLSAATGTKNFHPTISGNTISQTTRDGISISLTEVNVTGTGILNFTPIISGNTITGGVNGIAVSVSVSSASTSAQVTLSPTISNNTIKSVTNNGIALSLSVSTLTDNAQATIAPLITQNSITNAGGDGISQSISVSASGNATATVSPMISNNTIDTVAGHGIYSSLDISALTNAQVTGTPTITGNSITKTGTDGIYMSVSVSASTNGIASITPMITNNTMSQIGTSGSGDGIYLSGTLSVNGSAQGTLSPTITGNTISTVNGRGIYASMSVSAFASIVGPPPAKATSSLIVSNNTISGTATEGIEMSLSFSGAANASLVANTTISGNQITSPGGNGISLLMSMTGWKNVNQALSIANNTVTGSLGTGLRFSADGLSGNAAGNGTFTITGNQITGSGVSFGNGADVFVGFWNTSKVNQTILIDGNTITNSSGTNLSFSASNQTSLITNDVRITNNDFSGGGVGASIRSDDWKPGGTLTNAVLFSCNTVTNSLTDGVIQRAVAGPPADYGGGNRSAPGGNRLFNNGSGSGIYDFRNEDDAPVQAQKNWWGTTNPATIDSHIFDDDENPLDGAVNFTPFKLANSGCVNTPPVANNDAYATSQATPLIVSAPGVLANDTDAEGDPLTAVLGTGPANGTLTLNSNGSFTYTPNAAFTGTDTFTYRANDGTANSNVATVTITVVAAGSADLSLTKTGPSTYTTGGNITYTLTVKNNGPLSAVNVQLSDPTPSHLTFISATGGCASFPCSLGTMTSGQSKTVQATYSVNSGTSTTIVNRASVSSDTADGNLGNNSASASTRPPCPSAAPSNLSPANGQTNVPLNGVLSWNNVGAASYKVYFDVQGGNCSRFFGATTATSIQFAGLEPGTTYQWHVDAETSGCTIRSSACVTFTTLTPCPTTPPTLISPVSGSVDGQPTFTWTSVAGAIEYKLVVNNNLIATTRSTTFGPVSVGNGPVSWFVIADFASPCAPLQSQTATFNACDTSVAPIPSLVAESTSGQGYDFTFETLLGALRYEAEESTDPNFAPGTVLTQSVTTNIVHYVHSVTVPTAFYYRVRAIYACGPGANSVTVRVVLAPAIAPTNPNIGVPVGSKGLVPIPVHIPGFPGQTLPFTATVDNKPWLVRVEPSSGEDPPEGVDLIAYADPSGLPNGTFTGTVIVTFTTPTSGLRAPNGTTTVSAAVSISLVTPVTPTKPFGTPPANALLIPSVGHLDAINSKWESNIRVANITSLTAKYQLTFSPDDPSKGFKQTIITVDPGTTTALDDIVKTWYGVGALGESGGGALEIRPFGFGKGEPSPEDVSVPFAVVSSHTFNISSNGTVGQFIPAVPFSNFIGRAIDSSHAAAILGMQQVAQSQSLRTNLGVLEASGQPATVLVTAFDSAGTKLLDFPLDLKANEQRQLNSFLAQNKIALSDGRLEVKVIAGEGKVTAYASVVDNQSGDPFLVPGVQLGQNVSDRFVLAGVADLNTGSASWRTDMRVLNPGTTAQPATLTFYPLGSNGAPLMASLTVNPGEVKRLDGVLQSLFAVSNTGGAIHVTTATPTALVVTGRTYNATPIGTFGQFVPAVTSADAVGKADRALQILQAEDSVRYRTNLGVAEVTGKPAMVEVQVFLPDSKISPSTQIPLPANGFIQVPVISGLGLTNIYNARISVRVVGGDGKITAYGSVIDQLTKDPTFVPAK